MFSAATYGYRAAQPTIIPYRKAKWIKGFLLLDLIGYSRKHLVHCAGASHNMIFTGQAANPKVLRTLNFFDTDRRTDGSQSFGYGTGFKAIEFVYVFIDQGASYHHRSRTSCAFWTIPSNDIIEHVDSQTAYTAAPIGPLLKFNEPAASSSDLPSLFISLPCFVQRHAIGAAAVVRL